MNSRSLRRSRRRARARRVAFLVFTVGILTLWTVACATRFPDSYIKSVMSHALQDGVRKV